ncbi:MAG: hypothetical protein IJU40_09075 [Desulfovibrionaceae bacterium]|nr:hypothetical protein [Desulfovibrionaceae bacterium]
MVAFINAGVVSPEECRQNLADDPDSGFSDIDIDDVPEVPSNYQDQLTNGFPEQNINNGGLLKKGDEG